MSRRVVIVGGGLAGLAAAAGLAEHGVSCSILESRSRLGGRASSFQDAISEEWVDNCQHVVMGCCTNFQHFCRQTGLDQYFQRQRRLYFVGPNGKIHRFAASMLPAPLHLAGAFAGLSYLRWSDKLALARGLRKLARPEYATDRGQTFDAWLRDAGQPPNAIRYFWQVVLVSALSESLDRISVPHARKVFVDGFLSHRDAWSVSIPTVPLEQLYGETLSRWLASRGVDFCLLTSAESVVLNGERATGVRLKSGETVPADEVIIAVPWHRVLGLLPPSLATHPQFASVTKLEAAPISSVHLWLDREITKLPHAVFVEGLCQWLFHRKTDAAKTWYYQVVISASREVVERDTDGIRHQVMQELGRVFPAACESHILHTRQVTEHRAVFSVRPGVDALRPAQQSPVTNLQCAGDWTQTGWPATMEGAVRSGYLAAENILRRLGHPAILLQPDLPTARLSRWLYGI